MTIKPGVSVRGLQPEIVLALTVAEGIWQKYASEVVVTCGTDSKHKRGSAHYTGRAVDLRRRNLRPEQVERAVVLLRAALGLEYDVILEETHVHVEYDPKGPA